MASDRLPEWLRKERPDNPGDGFYYGKDPAAPVVIFPSVYGEKAVLDGAFTAQELRDLADWIEG